MSINRIVLLGRLTAAPEIKTTNSGVKITNFTIAVDRSIKNADGEYEADFIQIVAWRQTAEFVSKYFTKGDMIGVDGRLQSRKYTTKDGDKRTAFEVVADNVSFGGAKRDRTQDDDYKYVPPPGSIYSPIAPKSLQAPPYPQEKPAEPAGDPPWPEAEQKQLPIVSDFAELDDDEHVPF